MIILPQNTGTDSTGEKFIAGLMQKMTLEEKIGQLVQSVGMNESREVLVKEAKIGSVLIGLNGAEYANRIQKIAVEETRLGIPLLFANDVLHGYKTIFPVPLGNAASWNPDLVKKACSIAAFEAASEGTRWTYAPMIDITRDPRWGRIMEGAGEDPYLGSIMAAAQVQGYQGDDISNKNNIAACAKHYVAYGAAEGGRDYNTTDMSERTLREIYLKPFHTAVDNNTASIMSAFNDLNGIPASANYFTLTQVLRNEWEWNGVVISDYNSIGELVKHKIVADKKEAALEGLTAGVDIDMVGDSSDGNVYSPYLEALVKDGQLGEAVINRSVKRVLEMKYKLGLFHNPYTDIEYYRNNELRKEYKDSIALQLARESLVLLKNDNATLPISDNIRSIAVIGPLADDSANVIGGWSAAGNASSAVTVLQGLKNRLKPGTIIHYSKGCDVTGQDTSGFAKAFNTAVEADMVLLFIGESEDMSGEAGSRANIDLPGMQEALAKRIYASGKPTAAIIFSGRPLTINWLNNNIQAIVEAWFPGTQAGNAIADVLSGRYNPSGKLPVTFPRSTGQIPLYYYHKNTGRPYIEQDRFTSKYLDFPTTPLYPFGYGLSYTTFKYSNIRSDKNEYGKEDSIKIYVNLTNTGKTSGTETAQLYIQDEVASISPAVKKLNGFKKVILMPGETKTLSFIITKDALSFYDNEMRLVVEPGTFKIMIGSNSEQFLTTEVRLK